MELVGFRSEATRILASIRPNATFLSIHHYLNNYGEISDFSVAFHVNYMNAIRRAKNLLEKYEPTRDDCIGRLYSVEHLISAKHELLNSYADTLSGSNPAATSAHAYDAVEGFEKTAIPGVKLHREQDLLHLWGFGLHKRVLFPGNYPEDRRSSLTIAKDDLRRRTPLGRFVQFKLQPGRFHRFVVEGITVKDEQVIRESHEKLLKAPLRW